MIWDIRPPQRFSFLLLWRKNACITKLCVPLTDSGSDVIDEEMLSGEISLLVLNCIKNRGTPQFFSTRMHARQRCKFAHQNCLRRARTRQDTFWICQLRSLKIEVWSVTSPQQLQQNTGVSEMPINHSPLRAHTVLRGGRIKQSKWAPVLVRQLCQGRKKRRRKKSTKKLGQRFMWFTLL